MTAHSLHPSSVSAPETSRILVDTHVHIYDCFNLDTLLQSAWNNFSQQSDTSDFTGVLLLTETARDHWFAKLSDKLKEADANKGIKRGQWTFFSTAEACSLIAKNEQGQQLIIVAGRQIITAEKLEVLALITDSEFEEGLTLSETIQAIQVSGGVPVLPWGVGKWLGNRGTLIENLLNTQQTSAQQTSAQQPSFFIGDNSNRPQFWKRPSQFSTIEQQGKPVLPGTDPLPIASQASRPGSFGLSLSGTLNHATPAQHLKEKLLSSHSRWEAYGDLEKPIPFFQNQLAMRM